LLCTGASAAVVINEIDYDQPSTDTAEFIELYNDGTETVDLAGYVLSLVNGATALEYLAIDLTGYSIAPGGFFVICANGATTPYCDLDVAPDTNLIQNGAPDAMALFDGAVIVDAVSYEGSVPGYGEGSPAGADTADPFVSLCRLPDGADTDDNAADFSLRCATPGEANAVQDTNCFDPVPNEDASWGTMKAGYR
jgi:hypothetical protein